MMIFSLFLFGLALGVVSPNEQADEVKLERGNCPMFWYSFNGRCYKYIAARMTWADAELHCVSQGANLVSIHSAGENRFVHDLINNYDPAQGLTWLGLSDVHKEGSWMWSDGSVVDFVFWHNNEPNNEYGKEHCANHNNAKQTWNDIPCHLTLSSVCATRKACP